MRHRRRYQPTSTPSFRPTAPIAPAAPTARRPWRAFSLIELLIVMAVMIGVVAILASTLTGGGSGGSAGVKEKAERSVASINLRNVHQGFYVWAQTHDGEYPSTKIDPRMESDAAHQVFKVLLEDGVLAGQQLMSPNEIETGFEIGYAADFGPNNTSYALNDYDADDWLRHRNWNTQSGSRFVLLSDRWVEIPGYEYNTINESYWYALFNDGHGENIETGALRNGDSLFDPDVEEFGADDALMIHD